VQGNPAQIWGEQGLSQRVRKAVEHAPWPQRLPTIDTSLFPTAARQLNALSLSIPWYQEAESLPCWATGSREVASVTGWRLMDRASAVGAWVVGDG